MLGVYLSDISSISYSWCLVIGVVSTLLPDLDFIWTYITKNKTDTRHRDLLHYPLIFTPIVFALGLLVSQEVAIVLALGSLAHFIHDSFGIGFGLKWLFPFRKNSYLFFFQTSTPKNIDMPKPKKWVYSWTDTQRNKMIEKYGYKDWIRHIYFRPIRLVFLNTQYWQ